MGQGLASQREAEEPLETLGLYGLSFNFPGTVKLEFNPKMSKELGDVALKSPKKGVVFVSWGPLARMPKSVSTVNDHAAYSLEKVKTSTRGTITGLDRAELDISGHKAIYNLVRVETRERKLGAKGLISEEARSVHVHCDASARYFVLYCAANNENHDEQTTVFDAVVKSFSCHSDTSPERQPQV